MKPFLSALTLAVTLGLAAPYGEVAAAENAAAVVATADQPSTTPGGTAFVLPQGWRKQAQDDGVLLSLPEAGSRLLIVEVEADAPDAAVAAAWSRLAMSPKFLLATDGAPRDGWEQRRFYQYDIATNAHRAVSASAFKRGKRWTILLIDVDEGAAEKRAAQFSKLSQTLLPAGYTRETFAGRTAHKLDAARLQQLATFVEEMRKAYEVPGVAIGIVQDGQVVMARGFGVRELGKPAPVDGDTRFMIASNTKALTTLMLARLVDAGKLDWNAPVTSVYPSFKLGDADITRQVLVKHLICACTGLPRQDMEWLFEGEKQTPDTVMSTLGTMKPTSGFGELFQYSNPMAAAAGYIGGQVANPGMTLGAGYDRAMQTLVFDPLGMRNTTFDYRKAQVGNFARPHGYDVDHHLRVMGMDLNNTILASRPAGAAWSSVNDLLKYVRMEIDRGLLPDGRRYIGEAALMQRREPQVALGSESDYAMGLIVERTYGVTLVNHGGDLDGFHSNMMWWPEQKVGAVILTNSDEGVMLRGPFKRRLMELMFDGEPQAEATARTGATSERASFDAWRKLIQWPADRKAVAALAAHYRNAALGDLHVLRNKGQAVFDIGSFRSVVATAPQPDGSLAFVMVDPQAAGLQFTRADEAGKRRLIVRDGQHEYVFDEVK